MHRNREQLQALASLARRRDIPMDDLAGFSTQCIESQGRLDNPMTATDTAGRWWRNSPCASAVRLAEMRDQIALQVFRDMHPFPRNDPMSDNILDWIERRRKADPNEDESESE